MSNTYKCNACRKDFKNVWVPNKLCCRLARNERRGLENTYSRYMTERMTKTRPDSLKKITLSNSRPASGSCGSSTQQRNNIAPFSSSGKPTCGHFFSRETDHRKQKIGIPPSNLVQWRSHVS